MRRTKFGKLLCLLLALCLGFALVACGTDPEGNGEGKITLTPATLNIKVGESTALTATPEGIDGAVTWKSSNESVVTVAVTMPEVSTWVVTVTGVAEGTAEITATAGGKTAKCTVTVTGNGTVLPGTETVTIKYGSADIETLDIDKDDSKTLTAVASNGSAVTWTSDNTGVVTVANGVITAVAAGTATVKASVSETVYDEVSVTVVAPVEIGFNAGDPTGWSYWNGDGDAVVTKHYYKPVSEEVVIAYHATFGPSYAVQIKYNNKYSNKNHAVALVVNASHACSIGINYTNQVLVAGDNNITVDEFAGRALYVEFGSEDNRTDPDNAYTSLFNQGAEVDVEFTLKAISITSEASELYVPSFTYNSADGKIAITDTENDADKMSGYQLGFFAEGESEPVYVATVVSGEAVDTSTVATGEYTVRLRALGIDANVIDSEWSETTATITVENANTPITATSTDGWYYWTEGELEQAYVDSDDNIHVIGIVPGSNPYSFQLQLNLTKAVTSITMNVHADSEGYLAFGQPAPVGSVKEVKIEAGDNSVTIDNVNITGTLIICFANNVSNWSGSPLSALSGDVVLSDIVITYAD